MKKIAIVYWSGTGNTLAMANELGQGAEAAGAEVQIIEAGDFSKDKLNDYDAIAFGCPAMGNEELEETVFEPMFSEVEPLLKGKPIVLFGSYEWADGEWMETWEDRCNSGGLTVVGSLAAFGMPDETAKTACRELGEKLA